MAPSGQLAIVQSKFTSGENVIIVSFAYLSSRIDNFLMSSMACKSLTRDNKAMEASLMQGAVKALRLLALVNKATTNALVILLTSRNPPQVYSDLTIERVIPIDEDFKCDIGMLKYGLCMYGKQ